MKYVMFQISCSHAKPQRICVQESAKGVHEDGLLTVRQTKLAGPFHSSRGSFDVLGVNSHVCALFLIG
jgi:hypothetical protein